MRPRAVTGILLLAVLAGCSTPSFTSPPGTQAFREGYTEGCDAGDAVAGSPFYSYRDKVEPPPKGDPHRVGWLEGYDRCRRNYQRIQGTVNTFLGSP